MTTIQTNNDTATTPSIPDVIRNEQTNTEKALDDIIIDAFKAPVMKVLEKIISKYPDIDIDKGEIIKSLLNNNKKQTNNTTNRKRKSPSKPNVPIFSKLTVENFKNAKSKEDLQKSFTMPQLKAILKQNNVAFNGGNKLRHIEFVWGIINPDEAPDPDPPRKRGRRPGSTNKKNKESSKEEDSNESDNEEESNDSDNEIEVHELTYDSEIYQVDPKTSNIYNDESEVIGKWDYVTNTPTLY